MQTRSLVWAQNELRFACPYFILGPKVFFPLTYSLFPSQVGHSHPTGKPLSCPPKWTARNVTSQKRHFVERLSNKKAVILLNIQWGFEHQPLNTGPVHKKSRWRPFVGYSSGPAVWCLNGIQIPDHLASNLFWYSDAHCNVINFDKFKQEIKNKYVKCSCFNVTVFQTLILIKPTTLQIKTSPILPKIILRHQNLKQPNLKQSNQKQSKKGLSINGSVYSDKCY